MNKNEILAKIEDIEHELQELKDMVEMVSKDGELLPVKAQTTPERPQSYDHEEFDIKDGVLRTYYGNSEEVNIPYGVTKIGQEAFYNNETIKKVNFPDTVTEIDDYAFFECENLVEVNNSKNVEKLYDSAFMFCFKLEKIDVDNVIEVKACGLLDCKNLKKLRFSKNIKKIGDNAFYGCENLNISIPETCKYVDSGEDYSFEGCKSVEIRK